MIYRDILIVVVGLVCFSFGYLSGSWGTDRDYMMGHTDGNSVGYAQGQADCLAKFVKVNS